MGFTAARGLYRRAMTSEVKLLNTNHPSPAACRKPSPSRKSTKHRRALVVTFGALTDTSILKRGRRRLACYRFRSTNRHRRANARRHTLPHRGGKGQPRFRRPKRPLGIFRLFRRHPQRGIRRNTEVRTYRSSTIGDSTTGSNHRLALGVTSNVQNGICTELLNN